MWADLLLFLPVLLALAAVALVIWFRREGRKDQADDEQPDQQAQRGGGGPTRPVVPK